MAEGAARRIPRKSFGRLLLMASRGFGINLLMLLGLGWIVPFALIVPLITGYVTGWNAAATLREGFLIGVIMGAWMTLLCGIIVLAFVVIGAMYPGGVMPGGTLLIAISASVLVLHLSVFGGIGAMAGGHFARKELTAGRPLV